MHWLRNFPNRTPLLLKFCKRLDLNGICWVVRIPLSPQNSRKSLSSNWQGFFLCHSHNKIADKCSLSLKKNIYLCIWIAKTRVLLLCYKQKKMLFNSLDFAVFLPVVFFLYWFVTNKNLKLQNLLLVVSSFVFYG